MSDATSKKKTRVSPPADRVSKECLPALLATQPAGSTRDAVSAVAHAAYEAMTQTAFPAMEMVDWLTMARGALLVMGLADTRRGRHAGIVADPGRRGNGAQFVERFEVFILVAGPWAGF